MSYAYNIQNDEHVAEKVGNRIAEMLYLKKDSRGYFDTDFGPKSPIGLARMVSDIIEAEKCE